MLSLFFFHSKHDAYSTQSFLNTFFLKKKENEIWELMNNLHCNQFYKENI